jgi:hypothetical protein
MSQTPEADENVPPEAMVAIAALIYANGIVIDGSIDHNKMDQRAKNSFDAAKIFMKVAEAQE